MAIERRQLGKTGVEVSVLGYGAMELRGSPYAPDVAEEEAGRLLNAVLDGGIDLIDTSIDYGKSETLIGRFVSHRRDEYFLASKCGCVVGELPPTPPPYEHHFDPAHVRAGIEQSLRRLRTDHLDLVQVHGSPSRVELEQEGTVGELERLRDEGKVRFIGLSGTLPHLPDHIASGRFDVFQIPYSFLQPEHEQLVADAAAAGAGVLVRGGVARGVAAEDKTWQQGPKNLGADEIEQRWTASRIDELLGGMSPMEFVLRFTITNPGLSSTIVGTSNVAHLRSNLEIAAKGPLPAELYAAARARSASAAGA